MPINTATDVEGWALALDEHLLDADTFADWLYGHCARQDKVSESTARKLAGLLSTNRLPEARAFGIPELVFILMTETGDVALRARYVLRERYLAAQSESVAAIKWRHEDGEREAATIDLDDECGDIESERVL